MRPVEELEHTVMILEKMVTTFREGVREYKQSGSFPGKRENLRKMLEVVWKPSRAAMIVKIVAGNSEE